MVQSSHVVFRHFLVLGILNKLFPTLVKMLIEGNERTFCVTLNNREPEPTSLDKVLLGSPINIVAASPKFYLQFISIIIHPFNAMEN